MKKIVINACFGGFGLSPLATKELAKLKGKECYFFDHDYRANKYIPITVEEATEKGFFFAYSVPNPGDYRLSERDPDGLYGSANKRAAEIGIDSRPDDRADPDLIRVVELLGKQANGFCADLKIIKIPDDVEWEISEYDGLEHIAEVHRTWS